MLWSTLSSLFASVADGYASSKWRSRFIAKQLLCQTTPTYLVSIADHKLYVPDKSQTNMTNRDDGQLMTIYRISIDYDELTHSREASKPPTHMPLDDAGSGQSKADPMNPEVTDSSVQCELNASTVALESSGSGLTKYAKSYQRFHQAVEALVVTARCATVDEATEPLVLESSPKQTLDVGTRHRRRSGCLYTADPSCGAFADTEDIGALTTSSQALNLQPTTRATRRHLSPYRRHRPLWQGVRRNLRCDCRSEFTYRLARGSPDLLGQHSGRELIRCVFELRQFRHRPHLLGLTMLTGEKPIHIGERPHGQTGAQRLAQRVLALRLLKRSGGGPGGGGEGGGGPRWHPGLQLTRCELKFYPESVDLCP
uniref:HTH CENPB-type domain-containing protein n=1 Tax=Macrostomum lignano TaxID=282301 RepID=A0A1I8FJ08_9PLAT